MRVRKNRRLQTTSSPNYANRDALFDGEKGLPKYNASIVKIFVDFLLKSNQNFKSDDSQIILDFGAGGGHLADIFRSSYSIEPICLEIDPELRKVLLDKKYITLKSLNDIGTPITMIYSSNVLEHIEDDSGALNEICTKLQQGGKLAIYVPALMFLFSELDIKAGHFRRYSKKDLTTKVENAGFKVEKCIFNDSIGVLASIFLKVFGYRNKLNLGGGKSLIFYDQVVYPVSQLIDKMGFRHILGKNLYILATKK